MRRGRWPLWIALLLAVAVMGVPIVGAQSQEGEPIPIGLEMIAEGLTAPVALVPAPDGSGAFYVVDQSGVIHHIQPDGTVAEEPFLDIRDKVVEFREAFDERGLLGLAFHPDFQENGRFFVYYSAPLREGAPQEFDHTAHISELQVSQDDPRRADPESERIVLQVDEPQFNHNGGTLLFGADDGYLYISLGDGGGRDDNQLGHVDDWYEENEGGNGQDIEQNLLGSILRIDVDGEEPYGIPEDNPFVDTDGLDEIYAYGFRNPYRMSFDMGGEHQLFAVDAGQELWEEISIIEAGGNYGWNVKVGTHCFSTETPTEPPGNCPDSVGPGHPDEGKELTDPVIEFANAKQPGGLGLTVSAGHVYRGSAIPELEGQFVFGTWSMDFAQPRGRLFAAEPSEQGLWEISELIPQRQVDGTIGQFVLGMGQDDEGEVYVLTSDNNAPQGNTGKVWRIVPEGEGTPVAPAPGNGESPSPTPSPSPVPSPTPSP